ncbi:MAG: hypothetical protein WDO70_11470 [Alphaproteobacteria bacterium]
MTEHNILVVLNKSAGPVLRGLMGVREYKPDATVEGIQALFRDTSVGIMSVTLPQEGDIPQIVESRLNVLQVTAENVPRAMRSLKMVPGVCYSWPQTCV